MPVHVIAARIYTGSLLYFGKTEGVLGGWHSVIGNAEAYPDLLSASRAHDSLAAFLQQPYVKSGFSMHAWADLYEKARVIELGFGEVVDGKLMFTRHKLVALAPSTNPNECNRFARIVTG